MKLLRLIPFILSLIFISIFSGCVSIKKERLVSYSSCVLGGGNDDVARGIAVDGNKNIYCIWSLNDLSKTVKIPSRIKNKYFNLTEGLNILSKYDDQLNLLWSRSWDSESYNWVYDMETDKQGNTYLANSIGYKFKFHDDDSFENCPVKSEHGLMLMKLDKGGNCRWLNTIKPRIGSPFFHSSGLLNSDVYYINKIEPVDDKVVVGYMDGVIEYYDSKGQLLSDIKTELRLPDIRCDQNGNLYVCGHFEKYEGTPYHFFNQINKLEYNDGTVIAKLDENGNIIWENYKRGYGLALTICLSEGYTYVTDRYNGIINFNRKTEIFKRNTGDIDTAYVSKYDSEGKLLWTKFYPNTDILTMVSDECGDIIVHGYYYGTPGQSWGVGNSQSDGIGFIRKYNSREQLVWEKYWVGDKYTDVHIAALDCNTIVVACTENVNAAIKTEEEKDEKGFGGDDVKIMKFYTK